MKYIFTILFLSLGYFGSAQQALSTTIGKETPFEVTYQSLKLFPNPVVTNAVLEFKLPQSSKVHVALLNILGAQVKNLINETLPSGKQSIQFSADQLERGTYFIRLSINNEIIKTVRVAISPS